MITIITDVKTQISLMLAKNLLESFAGYLINLEDAYLAFDYEPKEHKADPEKLKSIENFFFSYYESISPVITTLELAEHRYQALFQAARDAIFIVNRDSWVIVDVNLEAARLVERTKEELVGIKALDLELFTEGLVDKNVIDHLIDQPPPIISIIKESSRRQLYLEVSVNEIKLGNDTFIQYLFHDLSDIYLVEEKLKGHAKKIEILNKFISIANQANDLKDLLKKTIDYFTEFLNLKGCCIYLVDKAKSVAKIKAHKNLPQFFFERNDNLNINETPYDIVFTQGVALFNENFPEITKKFFKLEESISGVVIPLFSKLEIIGSINMLLNQKKSLSVEDMELIITIGLEIGTAIEKMRNQESLRISEAKTAILLDHIPFSIFRISIDGIIQDIKLEKKIEKILELTEFSQNFIGKRIEDVLPKKIAKQVLIKIENALEMQNSLLMKFVISYMDNQIIFQADIIPIGKNEVLVFLQNLTRTW